MLIMKLWQSHRDQGVEDIDDSEWQLTLELDALVVTTEFGIANSTSMK